MQGQLNRWGNSLAVRIPKALAEEARLREGDALELSAEAGQIKIKAVDRAVRLAALLDDITPDNLHSVTDWGAPQGNEAW